MILLHHLFFKVEHGGAKPGFDYPSTLLHHHPSPF